MKMTYGELIEELQQRPSEELYDIAEMAKRYAIEKRREEIKKIGEQNMRDYMDGKLDPPSDDIDELMRRFDAEG